MPDVSTKAKRSEVMSRIRGRGNKDTELALVNLPRASEFSEVKRVSRDAEVVNDVRNDAARHIARLPREGDEPVGPEGIRVMPVAAGGAEQFAADFPKPSFQLAAVVGRVFAHRSGGQNEFVAEGRRNG